MSSSQTTPTRLSSEEHITLPMAPVKRPDTFRIAQREEEAQIEQLSNFEIADAAALAHFCFVVFAVALAVCNISGQHLRKDGASLGLITGIFGFGQFVCGIFSFFRGNTYAATAFTIFGLHWISQGIQMFIGSLQGISFAETDRIETVLSYALMICVALLALLVATCRMNQILAMATGLMIFAFAVSGTPFPISASAAAMLASSALHLYLGCWDLINETWEKYVLPLFPHKDHKEEYEQYKFERKWSYYRSSMSQPHMW